MEKDVPILVYYGENEYELNKSIKKLSEETGYSLKEINDGIDFQDLIDILNTPALFEGNLIYKITNEAILNDDKNLELLKDYIKNPSPFSKGLIIVKKIDLRKKTSKFLKENNLLVEFPLRKGASLRKWIKENFWNHGYNVSDDAVAYLLEVVGENQIMIENELNKFFIYEPDHKNIGIKDLDILITNNVQSNIFNLLDSMFSDHGKMLKALENLFKLKEPDIKIVFMIIRELRIILRTKWFLRENYSEAKIASTLDIPFYFVEKKVELSKRMSFEEIFKNLKLFYEVEEKIKSGNGDGKMLLRGTLLSMK